MGIKATEAERMQRRVEAELAYEEFRRSLPSKMIELVNKAKALGAEAQLFDEDTPQIRAEFKIPAKIPPSPRLYVMCMCSQEWEVEYVSQELDRFAQRMVTHSLRDDKSLSLNLVLA